MTAKKILIYFLAIVMVFACSGVPSVVMAEDSADKMIVFNRGTNGGSEVSNILLPLNLASGGKYKLTFKMRTPNYSVPIIGSMRTTSKGYAFSEIGNVNNIETPDEEGLYCNYDAENSFFTAVIKIDRYGAVTAGGANCFLTIGSVERDGRIDTADYTNAFVFADPKLYKLDANGNETGDNLCPAINDNTLALDKTYNFSHSKECSFNDAEAGKWAIDTNLFECSAQDIPEGFFEADYTGSINALFGIEGSSEPGSDNLNKMIVFNPGREDNAKLSNILLPMNLSSGGKYKLKFKMRSFNGTVPIIGSMRTTGSGYAFSETGHVNNSATPDESGLYCSYDPETFMFAAVIKIDKYGGNTAGNANCFLTIGNTERDGTVDSSDNSAAFAFAEPELYKLDADGNETGDNLCPAINDSTLVFNETYAFVHGKECSFNTASAGKWTIDTNLLKSYALEIPDGFFTSDFSGNLTDYFYKSKIDYPDKMIVFNPASDNLSHTVSNILLPMNLKSGGKYKLSFKMRSFNGTIPIIGSMRTTGKGYAFSEVGNVNNGETPDEDGLYCSYDPETFTFNAVIKIDKYGGQSRGGANCFLTIGNTERDGRVDTANYAAAFAFALPELYLLDADGNATGENLMPTIDDDTLALDKTNTFVHSKDCGFGDADAGKWTYDSSTLYSYAALIPDGFFTADFNGDLSSYMEIPESYYLTAPQAVYSKPDNQGGDFGQMFYLKPGEKYVFEGYFKGSVEMQVRYHRADKTYLYNGSLIVTSDKSGKYSATFMVPGEENGAMLTDDAVKMFIGFRDITKNEGWAYDLKLYNMNDPKKVNLFVNPRFREGLRGWQNLNDSPAMPGDTVYEGRFPDSYELKQAGELPGFTGADIAEFFKPSLKKLPGQYMLHVSPDTTNSYSYFGQFVEFERDATYRFEVRSKTLRGTSFAPCLEIENGPLSKNWSGSYAGTLTKEKETYITRYEFTLADRTPIVKDNVVRAFVSVYDSTGECEAYCSGFKLCKLGADGKEIGENLFVNPDFKYGMYGWRGTGMELLEAECGGTRFTNDISTHELVPFDAETFIPDYTDRYFADNKSWADVFSNVPAKHSTETGIVRGFVNDENGDPIVGVKLYLTKKNFTAVTDEDGMFVFNDVQAGTHKLYVLTPSGEYQLASVFEVVAGKTYVFGTGDPIVLANIGDGEDGGFYFDDSLLDPTELDGVPSGTVKGLLLDKNSKPAKDVKLFLRGIGGVKTDNEGKFEFAEVPEGEYDIYTVDENGKENVFRKVRVLSGKSIKITLKETAAAGNTGNNGIGYLYYILVGAGVLLLAAGGITVFLIVRRKNKKQSV